MKHAEQIEWKKWRWEFMRRSTEYRVDYDRVKKLRIVGKYAWDIKPSHEEIACCEKYKWDGSILPDPEHSFDELNDLKINKSMFDLDLNDIPVEEREKMYLQAIQRAGSIWGLDSDAVNFKPCLKRKLSNKTKFTIVIDFEGINSIADLKDMVSSEIQARWDILLENGTVEGSKRNQIDYNVIIIVGDLRRKGLTQKEIARKIYTKKKFEENPDSKIRMVREYEKIYTELISGGYRKLTYP